MCLFNIYLDYPKAKIKKETDKKMTCKYCGSGNLILRGKTDNPMTENQVALVCADCGKWIKWVPKSERIMYLKNPLSKKVDEDVMQECTSQLEMLPDELECIKLLTVGASCYAEIMDILRENMASNELYANLYFKIPQVQGTINRIKLAHLAESNIDINKITSLAEIIRAMNAD